MSDLSPTPDDTSKCPKCGYTRDPGWTECPACGVVFARLRPPTSEMQPLSPPPPPTGDLYNPYVAPQAPVDRISSTADGLELAEPLSRLLAQLVNGVVLVVLILVSCIPLIASASATNGEPGCGFFVPPVLVLVAWIAWNVNWLSKYDQSVGKRLLSIRIVRSNGERASVGRLVGLRYLVGSVVLGQIPLYGLVDALFVFRQDRRCIHDHVADTIVVKTPPGWQGESF